MGRTRVRVHRRSTRLGAPSPSQRPAAMAASGELSDGGADGRSKPPKMMGTTIHGRKSQILIFPDDCPQTHCWRGSDRLIGAVQHVGNEVTIPNTTRSQPVCPDDCKIRRLKQPTIFFLVTVRPDPVNRPSGLNPSPLPPSFQQASTIPRAVAPFARLAGDSPITPTTHLRRRAAHDPSPLPTSRRPQQIRSHLHLRSHPPTSSTIRPSPTSSTLSKPISVHGVLHQLHPATSPRSQQPARARQLTIITSASRPQQPPSPPSTCSDLGLGSSSTITPQINVPASMA
ncbi:hypothetical protein ACLOJK_035087, partial [Asimina triloba]